jgi:ATP-dependent Clp protease protease subunit
MKKFWNWIHDDSGGRILRLEGPIDEDSIWGDEITPKAFREELEAEDGDVTVWVNSPGGNVFAAAEIYTMLKDYGGSVTVKIASIAASAASVVAMAGAQVQMSPTALLMIHDPSTIAMGNAKDMEKAIETLNEVKESIINAYTAKSGLSRKKVADLMSNETWMNAKKAVELGFADEILYQDKKEPDEDPKEDPDDPKEDSDNPDSDGPDENDPDKKKKVIIPGAEAHMYSSRMMDLAILNKLRERDTSEKAKPRAEPEQHSPVIKLNGTTEDGSMPYEILKKQLEFLK